MSTLTAGRPAHHGPGWDEQIVPALRKRLEAESRMLTKRMSVISNGAGDDYRVGFSDYDEQDSWSRPQTPQLDKARASPIATRPSAIPRPSYSRAPSNDDDQQQTPSKPPANGYPTHLGQGYPSSQPTRPIRQRTQSTPGLSGIPTPAASRSNSPMVVVGGRGTRIPTPTSNRVASPPVPAVPKLPNGLRKGSEPPLPYDRSFPPSPDTSPDLLPIAPGPRIAATSFSSVGQAPTSAVSLNMSVHSKHSADIIHEPAPFEHGTRLSLTNDDGERPFEHWYRGENRRNGGVGEVRVARHDEMMEIATYGHRAGTTPSDHDSRSVTSGRRRAGTVTHRASWFEDPQGPQVLDEQPLTDIDGEFSEYSPASRPTTPSRRQVQHKASAYYSAEEDTEANLQWRQIEQQQQPPPPALAVRTQNVPVTPGPRSAPMQQSQSAPRIPTTSTAQRGQPARKQTGPMSPAQKVAASAQRGRGARRGAAPSARSKSAHALDRPAPQDENEPFEYEMDAIPMWTQPKTGANWDDVVLPAVAKKMGIQDGYEMQDGTPRAPRRRESEERIAPAPGTFGFDDTKYRRQRPGNVQGMHLDEFGRQSGTDTEGNLRSDDERQVQTEPIIQHRPTTPAGRFRSQEPPPSPAPFAAYRAPQQQGRPLQPSRQYPDQRMPQVEHEQRWQQEDQQTYPVEKKEESSGCCGGCVVM